jgi:hypothetical protein
MSLVVNVLQSSECHVGIDLGRAQVLLTEVGLKHADAATFKLHPSRFTLLRRSRVPALRCSPSLSPLRLGFRASCPKRLGCHPGTATGQARDIHDRSALRSLPMLEFAKRSSV